MDSIKTFYKHDPETYYHPLFFKVYPLYVYGDN